MKRFLTRYRRFQPLLFGGILSALLPALLVYAQTSSGAAAASPSMDWLSAIVTQHGLWVGLVAVFVGGLALNLTPCVYPMIPVTLAFFSQQANRSLRRTVQLTLLYVVGISCSYAMLGLVAAKTGALLGSWLQHPTVLFLIAGLIVALALSMFGVYEFRLPHALTRHVGRASTGLWGACLMGLMVGVVAAPCIGPFVLGLFLYISQQANAPLGFLLFFTLGLGMGAPYLLLGIVANRVGALPKAGAWLVWTKKVLGVVLLGLALYFLRPILPSMVLKFFLIMLCLGAGMYLGWVEKTRSASKRFLWVRRLVGAGLIAAVLPLAWPHAPAGPTVPWQPYSAARLAQAKQQGEPVIIDVFADWCIPCVEMDHVTFHHAAVISALGSMAVLRIDVTRDVPPEDEALLKRFDINGVPTILLFDRDGRERTDLRVAGFVSPEELLHRLARLR